jgi:telomerase protein component 1
MEGESLPTALRKSLSEKFPDFDVYQLGKYNKERTIKKKKKKQRELEAANPEAAVPKKDEKPALTIKGMIRNLHIHEPHYEVMCILGKKYPLTADEFRQSKLPGKFEPEKIGKRMKRMIKTIPFFLF